MAEIKKISTELQLLDKFLDTSGDAGTSGQVLSSTGTGINWVSGGSLPGGPYLPLSAGFSYPLTGVLYIAGTIRNSSGDLEIRNQTASGFATATKLKQQTANGLETFLTLDGTSRNAYFTNQGNVGIGTTSPISKFTVTGTDNTNQANIGHSTQSVFIKVNGTNVDYNASGNSSGSHTFSTGNTERMRITSTGNVGIGTTSPSALFSVANTTVINGNGTAGWGSSANYGFLTWDGGTVNAAIVKGQNGKNLHLGANNRNNDLVITTAGNVGIGTTAPGAKLDVFGDVRTSTRYLIATGTANETAAIGYWDGVNFRVESGAAKPMLITSYQGNIKLGISGGTTMTIQSSNVGIGTTSPSELLEIKPGSGGDSKINMVNSSGVQKALIGYDNGNGGLINLYNEAGTRNVVVRGYGNSYFNGGNFGIGTTSPSEKLEVAGNIVGDGTLNTQGTITVGNGQVVLGGTGRIQGVDTVSASTDAANKAYVDAHGGGLGPFLPLAGGTMSGNTNHSDNVKDRYGTGNDFQIWHDGSNTFLSNEGEGHLNIINTGDDRDIIFKTDDGSGATTSYMVIDGSAEQTRFYKDTRHTDGIKANFGDSNDLQIYHDGSNSYINEVGVGDLIIKGGNDIVFQDAVGNILANMNQSNSVELYYGGSKKFETTSTGVTVTGAATATSGGNIALGSVSSIARMQSDGSGGLKMLSSGDALVGTFTSSNAIFPGNVGIGTTSPQSGFKLDVNGSSVTRGSAYVLTELNHYGTNDFSINASQGLTDIKFIAGGAERIRIKRQGNVGIGTTTPGYKLEVAGTARITSALTLGGNVNNRIEGTGSSLDFKSNGEYYFRKGANTHLTILSSGNVGIGTTSPSYKLDVNGVVRGDRFFVGTNTAASQWAFHARNNNSTADSGIYFNNNSSEIYLRNSSNVIGARIRSNSASYFNGGDVGIGTASPQERLHVSGETHPSIKLSSSSDGNYNVILNCGYRNEALNLSVGGYKVFTTEGFNTPETTHLYSNNSKALSLASNQAATFTSTVTATNFINSSDERLKENIEEVRDNNVEVNWKTFNFKTKKEQKRYGVIAQELEKTNPEFVREDSQGFKSVAYIDLLIAKIAELEARIQKLEK